MLNNFEFSYFYLYAEHKMEGMSRYIFLTKILESMEKNVKSSLHSSPLSKGNGSDFVKFFDMIVAVSTTHQPDQQIIHEIPTF